MRPCWQFFALVVVLSLLAHSVAADETLPTEERMAYISYVANDAYAIGGRVLGASLKATGTEQDLLMMVTSYVSQRNKDLLAADGWALVEVSLIENPFLKDVGGARNDEEKFTFAKLHIWNSTAIDRVVTDPQSGQKVQVHYTKLVYLDADISVVKNIDHLFECGNGLCGQMGKPYSDMWNINVGVLVLVPSDALLNDMLTMALRVGSNFKKGEAGFINKYFLHWCKHKKLLDDPSVKLIRNYDDVFKPKGYTPGTPGARNASCLSLHKRYNLRWSDSIGSTLIGNVLSDAPYIPDVEIIHYNGALKPWLWRLYPMHGWFRYWNQFTGSLDNLYWEYQPSLFLWLTPILTALAIWLITNTRMFTKLLYSIATHYGSRLGSTWMLRYAELVLVPYSMLAAVVAPVVVYLYEGLLPTILPIAEGWVLFCEWTLFVFWILYAPLCLYYYFLGFALITSTTNWAGGDAARGLQAQQQQQQTQQTQQSSSQQPQQHSMLRNLQRRFWFTCEWLRSSLGLLGWLGVTYLVLFYVVEWWSSVWRAAVLMFSPTACCVVVIIWVSLLPLDCVRMGKFEAARYASKKSE